MHHSIRSLIVLVLLCTVALSAPTQRQQKKRSFKVSRIRQRDFVPDGSVALRKAYVKYGLQGFGFVPELNIATNLVPISDLAASNGNSSEMGLVSATSSQNEAEFLSPVTVGGQTLVMDFDTGSSDMYVILPASNPRIL
jgi:hypothetical protein